MRRQYDLVCFDMDGTLTKPRSSWKWIHDCLGVDSEPNYKAFINQEIDEDVFMRRDISLWTGKRPDLRETDLVHYFHSMPLVEGIQETVASLRECGMRCVIISSGIDIATNMLKNEFGFDDCAANHIVINPDGTLAGYGRKIVDLTDKGAWVEKFQRRYGAVAERTVSVGNSFTDIPMFKKSKLSIAFNPTDMYTSDASVSVIRSENIADVLDVILPDNAES